jgi:hypothetical protein
MIHTVVRGVGSEMTHVVEVHADSRVALVQFGAAFTGFLPPLATKCGRTLRAPAMVMMLAGVKVKCSQCRRLTGIEKQENYWPVHQ